MKGFAERHGGCMRVRRFALVFKDQQLPFGRNSSDAVVGIVDILKGVQTAFQDLDNYHYGVAHFRPNGSC